MHAEWLAFLKQIDSEAPESPAPHMVIGNHSIHKHPKAARFSARSGTPEPS